MLKPSQKFLEFMKKKHNVTIGWKQKIAIIGTIMFFFLVLLPLFVAENQVGSLNQEIKEICANPMFYGCSDLEKAYSYCSVAMYRFNALNCSFS